MKYIWLNPIVQSIHDMDILTQVLKKRGFEQMNLKNDLLSQTKADYLNQAQKSKQALFDNRCPKAVQYIKNKFSDFNFSDIQPILIQCSIKLQKKLAKNDFLLVTTPCKELATSGNKLQLKNTHFITWKDFKTQYNIKIKAKKLNSSPIPMGFFNDLGLDVLSLSGKAQINKTLHDIEKCNKFKIIEILYCENGCHNGEGL